MSGQWAACEWERQSSSRRQRCNSAGVGRECFIHCSRVPHIGLLRSNSWDCRLCIIYILDQALHAFESVWPTRCRFSPLFLHFWNCWEVAKERHGCVTATVRTENFYRFSPISSPNGMNHFYMSIATTTELINFIGQISISFHHFFSSCNTYQIQMPPVVRT